MPFLRNNSDNQVVALCSRCDAQLKGDLPVCEIWLRDHTEANHAEFLGKQLKKLAQPFPATLVKPPAQGKYGDYVSHYTVTQRLLEIVGPFSFEVTQTIRDNDGTVTGVVAKLTVTIDGRTVSVSEVGDVDNPHVENKKGEEVHTDGSRAQLAASDALKRCAMRLGLGLHLWAGDDYYLFAKLQERERQATETPEDHE